MGHNDDIEQNIQPNTHVTRVSLLSYIYTDMYKVTYNIDTPTETSAHSGLIWVLTETEISSDICEP